jgi:hypothetical protein
LNPKICPNCNEGNTHDTKFCSKCKMIMSFEGYQEALESQKVKEDKLAVIEERFNTMQLQLQTLLSAVTNMNDQNKIDEFAKTLYDSGIVKAATRD